MDTGLSNIRHETFALFAAVAILAIVTLAVLMTRPVGQPLCTFTGGLGDDPIPPGYEHCFPDR